MALRTAAALLVGAGGAGAATMLALLAGDLAGGLPPEARVAGLAFALLATVPLAWGLTRVFKRASGALPTARPLASLGAFLWLGGLAGDLYVVNPNATTLLIGHGMALLGGLAFAACGALELQRPRARAA